MMPYTEVTVDNDPPFLWKNCEAKRCKNLVCIGLSRRFCFKHSGLPKTALDKKITVWVCETTWLM